MVIPLRDDNPTTRLPIFTVALIAINVIVYFGVQPRSGEDQIDIGGQRFAISAEQRFTLERAAIPCELRERAPLTASEAAADECGAVMTPLGTGELFPGKNVWLAVLVSMFLHGSILHLAGNMLFLWIFGNNIEDHYGHVVFVAFYVVTGVAAMAAHYLVDPASTIPVIGASGAIAGVMGAYLVLWPRARILTVVPLLLFFVIYLPAGVVLGLWFGLQFFTNPNEGVAWVAHVGGFAAGALLTLALRPFFGAPRTGPRPDHPGEPGFGDFRGGYPGRG